MRRLGAAFNILLIGASSALVGTTAYVVLDNPQIVPFWDEVAMQIRVLREILPDWGLSADWSRLSNNEHRHLL